jgi:hypothetical protein
MEFCGPFSVCCHLSLSVCCLLPPVYCLLSTATCLLSYVCFLASPAIRLPRGPYSLFFQGGPRHVDGRFVFDCFRQRYSRYTPLLSHNPVQPSKNLVSLGSLGHRLHLLGAEPQTQSASLLGRARDWSLSCSVITPITSPLRSSLFVCSQGPSAEDQV